MIFFAAMAVCTIFAKARLDLMHSHMRISWAIADAYAVPETISSLFSVTHT